MTQTTYAIGTESSNAVLTPNWRSVDCVLTGNRTAPWGDAVPELLSWEAPLDPELPSQYNNIPPPPKGHTCVGSKTTVLSLFSMEDLFRPHVFLEASSL